MLRFHHFLCLGLAGAFVVPLCAQGESIEVTLEKTIAAIERLAGLEQRLRQRDASAIDEALAATDAPVPTPVGDPAARDALLDTLRRDVVQLQGELEGDTPIDAAQATPAMTPNAPVPTTGLREDELRALATPAVLSASPDAKKTDASETRAFEPEGYVADSMRLGHAYYRAKKFEQALVMFENQGADVEASYWRARCLERLERASEALDAYAQVVAMPGAAWHAERAREDIEFLRWRIALEQKLAARRSGDRP